MANIARDSVNGCVDHTVPIQPGRLLDTRRLLERVYALPLALVYKRLSPDGLNSHAVIVTKPAIVPAEIQEWVCQQG